MGKGLIQVMWEHTITTATLRLKIQTKQILNSIISRPISQLWINNSEATTYTYSKIDQKRKYIVDNKNQLSRCQRRALQIWKGRRLE